MPTSTPDESPGSMQEHRRSFLRFIYICLAFIAFVAATQATVWPRWPRVEPLNGRAIQARLKAFGIESSPLRIADPYRTSDLARSAILSFKLPDGAELRLARGRVRHRFNLQTAAIAKSSKQLQLSDRSLSSDTIASVVGKNNGRWFRQTCYVKDPQSDGGAFAPTKDELTLIVDRFSSSRSMKLKSLIGLVPNRRYECVLVAVTSQLGQKPVSQLRWNRILEAIQPSLGL